MDTLMVAPLWFREALQHTPTAHRLPVLGKQIHYLTWEATAPDPNRQARSLLFVHGHAAHAHWWDFIAPSFSQQFEVAALDMSGNGDSEHRDKYLASQFAMEIAAVASELEGDTILVAHSFGGSMARIAAYLHPSSFSGLILVDSVIASRRRETAEPENIPQPRIRYYDSLNEAARRFRLRPPQPRPASYVLEHIAAHSVKPNEKGFQFKLDSQVFAKMWPEETPLPDGASMIRALKIPCAYIYGSQSRFCPPETITQLQALFAKEKLVEVSDAHHHLFLDQPRQFTQKLQALLEQF